MTPELRQWVADRNELALERGFFDRTCQDFFAVDWREDDADVVASCAEALGMESLTAEWRDEDLFIILKGRETKVPIKLDVGDRHVTLCTLNDLLNPDYEIRFLVFSHGSDAIGLVALSAADWRELEAINDSAVAENFIDPRKLPNVVTELNDYSLPSDAKARYDRMLNRK